MLFSICPGLHSPFNFPTGLQLLFTQIAVQLISSHAVKILWVTKLKYIWFIDRRLLDTFANIQGAIISKGKYFSDKKSFPLSFWVVWAVGHNRVWLGRQCWWLLSWGYCHLSEGRSALGPCVLSVRFRSSYRRNVNCSNRVFLRWLIAKFHVWVSVMGPVPGPILTGHLRWLSRGWCEHELARHWLIRTDKLHYWPDDWQEITHRILLTHWLQSYLVCSDHTQHCSVSGGSVDICSKVLTEDYNSANRAGSCMRSAYPAWCCGEQEDIPAECELELIGNMGDTCHVSLTGLDTWLLSVYTCLLTLHVAIVACSKQYLPIAGLSCDHK